MNVDETKELEAEYARLKAVALEGVNSLGDPFAHYGAIIAARDKIQQFCLSTGKDINLLQDHFRAEDLSLSYYGS